MIGKITKGNGFTGVCSYLLDKDEARLIGGNMASTTPRQLAAEFRVFSQKNIRVQLPVEHISLSPSPLDRELDDSEWEALAIDLLDGLGMNMNQYIVVLHNDTEFEGIRVSSDGLLHMSNIVEFCTSIANCGLNYPSTDHIKTGN
jgi:hypothetical protein